MSTQKLPPLELSLREVAGLIEKMEAGELTLEQSLSHFERGIILINHCQKIIAEAEQKVQILVQANQAQKESKEPQEVLQAYGEQE